jgi:membrane-bound ClpP family serine protease
MSITAIILIILLGFLLFILEFLIIPGITVAGIAAALLVIGGIFCGFYFHGRSAGNIILLATTAGMTGMLIVVFKMKTWQRFGLKSTIDGKVGVIEEGEIKVGDRGITISKLSPIGKAKINDRIYEVRSDGSYIESNIAVSVTHIDGNKIYIETKN